MADPIISQEVNIEMLEKLADGTYKRKYPMTKAELVKGLIEIINDSCPVKSVNGKIGDVNLTKSDVGLSNVQNYGVATQAEAEDGTATNKYMTPQRVKQAIEKLAGKIVLGSYIGASGIQTINVGFTPKIVIVYRKSTRTKLYDTIGIITDLYGSLLSEEPTDATKIVTNGFTVSSASGLKDEGKTYYYIAIV